MSRYGNNHSTNSTIAAANNMLVTISAKEESYKQSIAKNHAYCKNIASRLMINNDNIDSNTNNTTVEDVLTKIFNNNQNNEGSQQSNSTNNKVQDFLQEQRERLKKLTKQNIEDERTVSLFCTSLKTLQTDHLSPTTATDATTSNEENDKENTKEGEPETIKDYQILLEQIMIQESEKQKQNQITIEHESLYRDMCASLGEPLSKSTGTSTTATTGSKSASSKKRRGKKSIVEEDDDDDLVCISRSNKVTIESLKCPITGMLMDDPVKNKICHHTYSREGITNHISVNHKSRGLAQCPVFGCSNTNVTLDQLETDYDMEIKIRQEKRQQSQKQQQQSQQSNRSNNSTTKNVIDDDDDENDNDDNDVGEEEF